MCHRAAAALTTKRLQRQAHRDLDLQAEALALRAAVVQTPLVRLAVQAPEEAVVGEYPSHRILLRVGGPAAPRPTRQPKQHQAHHAQQQRPVRGHPAQAAPQVAEGARREARQRLPAASAPQRPCPLILDRGHEAAAGPSQQPQSHPCQTLRRRGSALQPAQPRLWQLWQQRLQRCAWQQCGPQLA